MRALARIFRLFWMVPPKNPYLNQVTPRKDLPNFPSQKNPGIEISNPKNPSIIPVTWIWGVSPPPVSTRALLGRVMTVSFFYFVGWGRQTSSLSIGRSYLILRSSLVLSVSTTRRYGAYTLASWLCTGSPNSRYEERVQSNLLTIGDAWPFSWTRRCRVTGDRWK